MQSAVDHCADQGTALVPFPHLYLFEMFRSVFMLKVSFFFEVKCTCNFIQYMFFLLCMISHLPSHSSPPFPIFKAHIYSKNFENVAMQWLR